VPAHPRAKAGLGQHPAQRLREAARVAGHHEHPGAAGEQFHRVRETGGDHRLAGGDRLDQHARGDLLQVLVGQYHHVRAADEVAEGASRQVPGIEVHQVADVPGTGPLLQ
jgi:hypothetical protein